MSLKKKKVYNISRIYQFACASYIHDLKFVPFKGWARPQSNINMKISRKPSNAPILLDLMDHIDHHNHTFLLEHVETFSSMHNQDLISAKILQSWKPVLIIC